MFIVASGRPYDIRGIANGDSSLSPPLCKDKQMEFNLWLKVKKLLFHQLGIKSLFIWVTF